MGGGKMGRMGEAGEMQASTHGASEHGSDRRSIRRTVRDAVIAADGAGRDAVIGTRMTLDGSYVCGEHSTEHREFESLHPKRM